MKSNTPPAKRKTSRAPKTPKKWMARLLFYLIVGVLALGTCYVGFRFLKQYVTYQTTPEVPKEPWQKYT